MILSTFVAIAFLLLPEEAYADDGGPLLLIVNERNNFRGRSFSECFMEIGNHLIISSLKFFLCLFSRVGSITLHFLHSYCTVIQQLITPYHAHRKKI